MGLQSGIGTGDVARAGRQSIFDAGAAKKSPGLLGVSRRRVRNLYSTVPRVYWMRMSVNPGDELDRYKKRIAETLREFGIPESFATGRRQTQHLECEDLVSIGLDQSGREQRLERGAAARWQAMRQAADSEGIALAVVSAFRSFDYQKQIIARKLAAGQSIERILSASALPGFSEHHSGRAIDVGTPGCPPLTEEFETTDAYTWLTARAHEFGFTLSYPRGNPHGIMFEPWHWVFSEP